MNELHTCSLDANVAEGSAMTLLEPGGDCPSVSSSCTTPFRWRSNHGRKYFLRDPEGLWTIRIPSHLGRLRDQQSDKCKAKDP